LHNLSIIFAVKEGAYLQILRIWFDGQVQYGYDQAKADKERAELEVMKLNRELEKLQYQVWHSTK
jgi:hypothetical protein